MARLDADLSAAVSPAAQRAAAFMRSRFITLSPATSLRDAAQVMRVARVRFVPVVRGERLVGLLANRDVLAHSVACASGCRGGDLARLLSRVSIGALVQEVEGVSPDDSLVTVVRRLIEEERGCLPVVTPGPGGPQLVGLLTEADLLRAAFQHSPAWDEGPADQSGPSSGRGAHDPIAPHD
jgi:CBS domain-containing protein